MNLKIAILVEYVFLVLELMLYEKMHQNFQMIKFLKNGDCIKHENKEQKLYKNGENLKNGLVRILHRSL